MKTTLPNKFGLPVLLLAGILCSSPVYATEKVVTLTQAGTIADQIGENEKWEITKLTVSGPINGTDILFIREMVGRNASSWTTDGKVTELDLSGANIVAGGDSYVFTNNFTEDNVVGPYMFAECDKLVSVALPVSATAIGSCVFYRCYELVNAEIPAAVTSIGSNAYFMCEKMSSVVIPKNVTKIDDSVFCGCKTLKTIDVEAGNTVYKSIDGVLFDITGETLMAFPGGITGEYTTPAGVKSIAPGAFNEGSYERIVLGEGVTLVGDGAFSNTSSLKSITFPNSLVTLESTCFMWCDNLEEIIWGDGLEVIGDETFVRCYGLKNIVVPASVKRIGRSAFANCQNLETITIGAGVEEIGLDAFISDKKLTDINVDEANSSYSSIGGVLLNKDATLLYKFPQGKEGEYEVPATVSAIDDEAFYACELITGVKMGDNVKKIGMSAFSGCYELKSAALGNGITEIPDYAFESCDYLETVTFGDITSIGEFAFSYCTALETIDFPATLSVIANDAFASCRGLKEIQAYGTVPPQCSSASGVFYGVTVSAIKMYVPESELDAYNADATWSMFDLQPRSDSGVWDITASQDCREHFVRVHTLDGRCVFTGTGFDGALLDSGIYIIDNKTTGECRKVVL